MVLFKNPRDASQIVNFAKQIAPGDVKRILDSFNDATKRPYSYMLFDLHQSTPEDFRMRTNIFRENSSPMKVYMKKR
jgi:hypothetical protein